MKLLLKTRNPPQQAKICPKFFERRVQLCSATDERGTTWADLPPAHPGHQTHHARHPHCHGCLGKRPECIEVWSSGFQARPKRAQLGHIEELLSCFGKALSLGSKSGGLVTSTIFVWLLFREGGVLETSWRLPSVSLAFCIHWESTCNVEVSKGFPQLLKTRFTGQKEKRESISINPEKASSKKLHKCYTLGLLGQRENLRFCQRPGGNFWNKWRDLLSAANVQRRSVQVLADGSRLPGSGTSETSLHQRGKLMLCQRALLHRYGGPVGCWLGGLRTWKGWLLCLVRCEH